MRKYIRYVLILAWVILFSATANSQSLTKKLANQKFKRKCYAEAIVLYEELIQMEKYDREVYIKLAECYREIKDTRNALKLYAILAHEEDPAPENIWNYAQALAQEEKYDDAKHWYEVYSTMMPNDEKAWAFSEAYKKWQDLFKDSARYRVEYLPAVNSWQSDFSPVYYGKGILFCSARQQGVLTRKVSEYDQSSLLDWYFISDTSAVLSDLHSELYKTKYTVDLKKHRNDDYTRFSSVDSEIPAHYGNTFLFDSVKYTSRPVATIRTVNHPFSNRHLGPVCFFKDQQTILYTTNHVDKKAGTGHLNLYSARIENGEWKEIKRLPFNNDNYSTAHPAFSPDYSTLYFASDMPGGKGGTDIYSVQYDNGAWSDPVNVSTVNTPGNESFPYVDQQGNLYFSSNGYPGLGGLDLFCATIQHNQVQTIRNMGAPINSSKDDFGITISPYGNQGYFSSNRKRGLSDDDIYYFSKGCKSIELYVYDDVSKQPVSHVRVDAGNNSQSTGVSGKAHLCLKDNLNEFVVTKQGYENFTVSSSKSYIEVPLRPLVFDVKGTVLSDAIREGMENVALKLINLDDNTTQEWVTGNGGGFNFPLKLETNYKLIASKDQCGTNSLDISTKGLTESKSLHAEMVMLCTGDIITIENIYYDLNEATIRADAATSLDNLADLMIKYPDMRIELRAHTDSRAEKSFNLKLSALRAQSVVDYLTTKGIVPYRMRAVGFGESQPLNGCVDGVNCSEDEHQLNRRTEFKVLSVNTNQLASN